MIGFDWSEWTVLRFVGASFILWLCYYLLFDRKAPFNQCRTYLLYSVLLAGIISVVRIPVYPVEIQLPPTVQQMVTIQRTQVEPAPSNVIEKTGIQPDEELPATQPEANKEPDTQLQKTSFYESWNYWQLAWSIYGLGVLTLLIHFFIQILSIWRLKRWGSCTTDTDGICIVRNSHIISPFSFYRTIFINRKIEGEVLEIVLLHEKLHIRNHHYRDTILIECLCILCWFNPFVWLIKRDLRALHEFQVDRCMLSDEVELFKYQSILFEELMGYSPNIANGFHNSLIKKRFIMMKLQYKERFVWLRKIALFSLLVGMLALFSFTEKPVYTESDTLISQEGQETGTDQTQVMRFEQKNTTKKGFSDSVKINITPDAKVSVTSSVRVSFRNNDTLSEKKLEEKQVYILVSDKKSDNKNEADLRPDQIVISRAIDTRSTNLRFVERAKDETRVTIAIPISYDRHWIQFEKGLSIVDEGTQDIYRIRSVTRGIELNKTYWVVGMKNRMVEFTLVFPPLDKKVKIISIRDCFPEEKALTPPNGGSWHLNNLDISDLVPTSARLEEYDKEGRPVRSDKLEEVTLRPDQLVLSPYGKGQTRIVKIETTKENTSVVLSIPIHFNRGWIRIGKGLCIVDRKTGATYPIQGVARDIELNKLLWVEGCEGRSILMTLIFPKLGDKVKNIDLYYKYPDANSIIPTNDINHWSWKNIKIKDYQKDEHRRIIL